MFFSQLAANLDSDPALPSPGTDLLPNPNFDPNPQIASHHPTWIMANSDANTPEFLDRGWSFCLSGIHSDNPCSNAHISLFNSPKGMSMELCLKALAPTEGNYIQIRVSGFNKNGAATYLSEERYSLSADMPRWIRHQIHTTADVKEIKLDIIRGPGSGVLCSKIRLIAGLPTALPLQPTLEGAGLLYVSAKTDVRPEQNKSSGTVSFPIPIRHGSQIPIAFEVTTTPASALKGYRWEVRPDGKHIICHVAVDAQNDEVSVNWESLVFVEESSPNAVRNLADNEVPGKADPCLASSELIQANHKGIRARANLLAEGSLSISDFARRVAEFSSVRIYRPKSLPIDAISGLNARGGEISGACLAAALFRAQGIPARTLAYLPSESCANPAESWLVEWWHSSRGWTRLKLHRKQPDHPENSGVVLKVANFHDENVELIAASESMHKLRHSRQASSPPLYATCFLSNDLKVSEDDERGLLKYSNIAHPVMALHQEKRLLDSLRQACKRAWQDQLQDGRFGLLSNRRNRAIVSAVRNQSSRELLAALVS